MLTIADEGGRGGKPNADHCWRGGVGVRKNFNKRSLRELRMLTEKTIDLNLTMYVYQSHITCKLDPNKWISPILSCQKVYVKNCSTKGLLGKCWRKLTREGGGVSQKLTIADVWGGVYEPPILADLICEEPLSEDDFHIDFWFDWIDPDEENNSSIQSTCTSAPR